jgi:D-alanyl-D-alanine carboxypeptidase
VPRTAWLFPLVLLLPACAGGGGDAPYDGDETLGRLAADAVDQHAVPAVAVAVIDAGAVRAAVASHRSYGSEPALEVDAPFHLGSDTKAMTAAVLGTFVEEGAVSLDDTLQVVFPEVPIDASLSAATLRDVMAHRAGIIDAGLDLRQLHKATDIGDARADVVNKALTTRADTAGFHYANTNYVVLGAVIERLSGSSWEDAITRRLFEPLGTDCGFGAPTGSAPHTVTPPEASPSAGTRRCATTLRFCGPPEASTAHSIRGHGSSMPSSGTCAARTRR